MRVIWVLFSAAAVYGQSQYVGSTACKTCHAAIYERWSKTRMANVVRDPKTHPDAILPDLSKPDPLVKFTKDDIAFVYGSKWKQRYFTKSRRRLFPARRAVGRHQQIWRAYMSPPKAPTGGPRFIRPTTCSGPPARSATAAIP